MLILSGPLQLTQIAAKPTMTVPDTDRAADSSTGKPGPVGVTAAATSQPPGKPVIPAKFFAKAKQNNIHLSPAVLDAAARDGDDLLRSLRTAPEGLTQSEAESRAQTVGPNEVAQERPRGWFIRLLIILRNPLVVLLAVLSSISYATGDMRAGTVMACMVLLSVTLRFVQEARADAAAAKLKAMIHVTATVLRDGSAREVPLRDLVPGDVVKLSAGDMIPGDVRLLTTKDLFVSQGTLTGESMPVEKFHDPEPQASSSPTELKNTCFLGTSVQSGTATAVVVVTGVNTYLGSMAGSITEQEPPTSFDRGLSRFTWLMIQLMAVMVPLVFLINGLTKHDWKSAFFFAMAVAVGLTPEMLPMIVSVCLAKGAIAMSRKKVIVKRLNAIQNFGGMDVLCTDKTGTLTEDRVVLQRHCNVAGRETDEVLLDGYLISHFQTGLKNLLDTAILNSSDFHQQELIGKFKKLDEIPFDFTRRMMSVMVEDPDGHAILLTKGAPEEIFQQCSQFELDGKLSPMDPALIQGLKAEYASLSGDGFRVLAVARKDLDGKKSLLEGRRARSGPEGIRRVSRPAQAECGDRNQLAAQPWRGSQDSHRRQRPHQPQGLRRRGTGARSHAAGRRRGEDDGRRAGGGGGEDDALRAPLARPQAANRARAAGQGTRRRIHGRRHQRRARAARRGHRHLGGHGGGHCQGIGGPDPAGEGPECAGTRRDRRAQGLRQHPQVHSHGRQFQLWKYVQRAGRERVSAVHTNGPDPDPDQQHALRRSRRFPFPPTRWTTNRWPSLGPGTSPRSGGLFFASGPSVLSSTTRPSSSCSTSSSAGTHPTRRSFRRAGS